MVLATAKVVGKAISKPPCGVQVNAKGKMRLLTLELLLLRRAETVGVKQVESGQRPLAAV
jgi:hypothetical protein